MRWSCSFLLSCLLLTASCSSHYYIQQRRQQQYVIENTGSRDSSLVQMLRPYKQGVDTQMNVVIGHTDLPLTKAQPESTLGNFLADATLVAAQKIDPKVVAAIGNYGGIRISYINPGPITRGKIYELMPFDNMLTIMELPGSTVKQLCDAMARYKGWPVSGLQFAIKDKAADGILIGGAPLDEHRMYLVALSDYIARGGDNCDFLVPLKKRYTTVFLRDALIDYVTRLESAGKPLHPVLEKRIQYAE